MNEDQHTQAHDRILDSDPSGNAAEGLAGDMGISSERTAPLRGGGPEATHGVVDTSTEESPEDAPPEQSADPRVGGPETQTPEDTADYRMHHHDPDSAIGHSH
jgi:hypothetical protein